MLRLAQGPQRGCCSHVGSWWQQQSWAFWGWRNPAPSFSALLSRLSLPPQLHPSSLSSFPCPAPFPHSSGTLSAPPAAPLSPRHGFLQLLLPPDSSSQPRSISMQRFPPSSFLGKSSSAPRAGSLLPVQVLGPGASGAAAAGAVGLGVSSARGAAGWVCVAQSWRDSGGKFIPKPPRPQNHPSDRFQGFVPKQLGTNTHTKKTLQATRSWNLREIAAYFSFMAMR